MERERGERREEEEKMNSSFRYKSSLNKFLHYTERKAKERENNVFDRIGFHCIRPEKKIQSQAFSILRAGGEVKD